MLKVEDVFPHYALLYIRYVDCFKKLEDVYDQTVHPQKLRDMKLALESCMGRMLELKLMLTNMPDTKRKFQKHGDFLFLDEMLEDLKMHPNLFELPVPKYFVDDRQQELAERDALLTALVQHYEVKLEKRKRMINKDRKTINIVHVFFTFVLFVCLFFLCCC